MKKIFLTAFICFLLFSTLNLFSAGKQESDDSTQTEGIWVWGTPAWGGVYEEEILTEANKWLNKKFGITIRKISPMPQGTQAGQAFNLLTAKGEMPDVINGFGGLEATKFMVDLAEAGTILDLTPYFNDPQDYPIFSNADKAFLRAYMHDGKIYGFPTFGWPRDGKSGSYGTEWAIRDDIIEKYGRPTTMMEVLEVAKKIKADGITDANGEQGYPFAIHMFPEEPAGAVPGILGSTFGSGWEVDQQKRLMPVWASKEYKDALNWLNVMWREGLMNPGQWMTDQETLGDHYNVSKYGIVYGPTWVNAQYSTILRKQIDEGKAKVTDESYQEKLGYVMRKLEPPISDNPGLLTVGGAGYAFISADTPNPDGVMKLLEWYQSDEALISTHFDAGLLGVDWEWAKDEPWYWQTIGEEPGTRLRGGEYSTGSWIDSKKAEDNPPRVPPVVHYISTPSYDMFYNRVWYEWEDQFNTEKYGFEFYDEDYVEAMRKIRSPIPSYQQVIADLPPQEAAALNTVGQRIAEGLVGVITSESESVFEQNHTKFLQTLISVTNWKPIYTAKQQRWVDWLNENNIDDRNSLGSVTPLPLWEAVMGW
jgi:hypothetical protein